MSDSAIEICKKNTFFEEAIDYLKNQSFKLVLIGSGKRQAQRISPILKKIKMLSNLEVRYVIARNQKTGSKLANYHKASYLKSLKDLNLNLNNNLVAIISVSNSSKFLILLKIIFFNRRKFKFLICESLLTPNLLNTLIINLLSKIYNLPILILSDQSFYPEVFAISNAMDEFNILNLNLVINLGSELTYHFLSRLSNLNLRNRSFLQKNKIIFKDLSLRRFNQNFNPNEYIFKSNNFQISRYSLIKEGIIYPLNYKFSYLRSCLDPNSKIEEIYLIKEKKIILWQCINNNLMRNLSKQDIGLTYSLLLSLCHEHFKVGYDSKKHSLNQLHSVIIGFKNKLINIFS